MSRAILWLLVVCGVIGFAVPATIMAADTVCIDCHGGLPDALGAPVSEWQNSIHAKNGVSCHDCHGGDPTDIAKAKNPEKGFLGAPEHQEIPDFCGRCHVGVADAYKTGAHGQAIEKGAAQCVTCHGNHAVKEASLDLINEEDCSRCHEYDRAALIRLSLVETETLVMEIEKDLDRLYRLGFAVDEMEGALFNQRNIFRRVFHGVDVDRVRKETGGVQAELGKLKSSINEVDVTIGKRKLWGSVVIGLFVLAGVIFLLVRKAYEEEENS